MDFYMKDKHSYLADTLLVRLLVANCADERRQTEKQKDRLTDRQTVLFLKLVCSTIAGPVLRQSCGNCQTVDLQTF